MGIAHALLPALDCVFKFPPKQLQTFAANFLVSLRRLISPPKVPAQKEGFSGEITPLHSVVMTVSMLRWVYYSPDVVLAEEEAPKEGFKADPGSID